MTKNNKKKMHRYFRYVIIMLIISSVLVATIVLYNINGMQNKMGEQIVYSNEHYVLRGNPTELQKELFKELSSQIEKNIADDFDVVELVVKSFIADYYTWTNKQGSYDVGGSDFIFANEKTNFYFTTRRNFYSNMSIYLEQGLTSNDLIEVELISMGDASYSAPYYYYGTEYKAFYVEASWSYKENTKVDISKFSNFGSFTIIQTEENRYEIVRFY